MARVKLAEHGKRRDAESTDLCRCFRPSERRYSLPHSGGGL